MMDDAEVKAMLDGATPGPWRADGELWNRVVWSSAENRVCFMAHSNGLNDERDIATSNLAAAAPDLARALLAARADAEAAVALALEEAVTILQNLAQGPASSADALQYRSNALLDAIAPIRALAPASAVAKLAKLRERAEKAEADMRVWMLTAQLADQRATDLTAEVARLRDRERVLVEALINRDGGSHDEDCKARRYGNSNGPCNCGHDEVVAALATDASAKAGGE